MATTITCAAIAAALLLIPGAAERLRSLLLMRSEPTAGSEFMARIGAARQLQALCSDCPPALAASKVVMLEVVEHESELHDDATN